MASLGALQRDFMAALYADDPADDARIEIYRRSLRANLGDALAATFPVVERLVGASFFRAA
ncbi:MAG: putative DNA-binding domain-containing protein, partial [Bacillota bacterium]